MHVYFCGIGGAGLSALAQLCLDCGYTVSGSDAVESINTRLLEARGVKVHVGQNDGWIEEVQKEQGVNWFIYSAGIGSRHPERQWVSQWNVQKSGAIKETKRHDLLNYIIKDKGLKLLAISGTHGKTTTTGMLVWLFKRLKIPVSYSVGSNISFGASAEYAEGSEYFVYEADEFDKNMLQFHPDCVVIPSLDYDHHDTYTTIDDYRGSFVEFINRAERFSMGWEKDLGVISKDLEGVDIFEVGDEKERLDKIDLIGDTTRQNGFLVWRLIEILYPQLESEKIVEGLNKFPGTQRRLEQLKPGLYTDYAHHPEEIKAVLQQASELSKDVTVVYQPHQNIRQHRLKDEYKDCFALASQVFWLSTYLSREDKNLKVLAPEQVFAKVENKEIIKIAEMNSGLWSEMQKRVDNGGIVLVLGAGDVDDWVRDKLI